MSQDGSTVYPLTGEQIRTLARVQIEFESLLDQNKTLGQMVQYCDSIKESQVLVIVQKDVQLKAKQDQIDAKQKQFVAMEAKYMLSYDQIKSERKKKQLYMGTTVAALLLLALSLLN